ncbi:MAG: AAA family ATPase [Gammaproteobacteria bacterium]
MIIERLCIANFRGVLEREVCFDRGVTVVEGPNEAGKSSLKIALNLLLTMQANSKHRVVKACKPVDRDEGPQVEAELRIGRYHVVYSKRFLKAAKTELQILEPAPENLTGADAHARMEAILGETVDMALWRALQITQGRALEQATLENAHSLGQALDRAAGGEGPADEDLALIEAARREYEIYFTPKDGKERPELKRARQTVDEAQASCKQLATDYDNVEMLVSDHERLSRDAHDTSARLPELQRQHEEHVTEQKRISEVELELAQAREGLERARVAFDTAKRDLDERETLVKEVDDARKQLEDVRQERVQAEPELEHARERHSAAERERDETRAARKVAEQTFEHADRIWHWINDRRSHDALAERLKRAEAALELARTAGAEIEANLVTPEAFEQTKAAHDNYRFCQQRLRADAPRVELNALAPLDVEIDGEFSSLPRGESRQAPVVRPWKLVLPGRLALTVSPGVGAHDLELDEARAADALQQCLRACEVDSFAAGERAHDRRIEAVRRERDARDRHKLELAGESLDDLGDRVRKLEARLASYADLPAEFALDDADAAEPRRTTAQWQLEEARKAADTAEANLARLLESTQEGRDRELRLKLQEERTAENVSKLSTALEAARELAGDEALREALRKSQNERTRADEDVVARRREHEALEPDRVATLCENARLAFDRASQSLQELTNALHGVAGQLEALQGRGLHEALERARGDHEQALAQCDRLMRDAQAARRLYEILKQARDEARRRYVEPLTARIESLAKIVFGRSLSVQLGPDLKIESRTLNGRTVPFDGLSGGTREQLDLLTRVAAALIVSDDNGVPLIFDDTLGSTDPERLQTMGAALAKAGEFCQVIVLTCFPGRFSHVGNARVERLAGAMPPL